MKPESLKKFLGLFGPVALRRRDGLRVTYYSVSLGSDLQKDLLLGIGYLSSSIVWREMQSETIVILTENEKFIDGYLRDSLMRNPRPLKIVKRGVGGEELVQLLHEAVRANGVNKRNAEFARRTLSKLPAERREKLEAEYLAFG